MSSPLPGWLRDTADCFAIAQVRRRGEAAPYPMLAHGATSELSRQRGNRAQPACGRSSAPVTVHTAPMDEPQEPCGERERGRGNAQVDGEHWGGFDKVLTRAERGSV
jgi:hypothetical protein